MFAVHAATRRTHAPSEDDLEGALKILKYLKDSKELKLMFKKWESTNGLMNISGYADADWADNKSTRKSVSGGIVSINGMPVQWICKKQSCVSLSTLEAEFIAGTEVSRELLGLKQLAEELQVKLHLPIPLWMDNKEGIVQIEQESSSSRLKHVDMKFKFLCDRAKKNQVVPSYVRSEDQVGDIFTKPLSQQKILKLRELCGLSG